MSYTFSSNLRSVMINNMTQFESTDEGSNLGLGYAGWDDALAYAREYNKLYFGSIFLASGESQSPESFSYGMWAWTLLVRMHVRYDGKNVQECDQGAMDLATDFVSAIKDVTNRQSVAPSGWVKLTAANYLSQPVYVNEVPYISMEFLILVKEQI